MKADSLARMMSSTGFSFSLTPGIARTFATSSLSLPRWSTAILLMELLAASGSLSQRDLEVVELGCQVGELGSGRFRRGDVLDATENVGERAEDAGQVGAQLGRIRKGNRDLGHDELWHGLRFFLLDHTGASLTTTGVSGTGFTSAGWLPKKYHASAPSRPRATRGRSQPGSPELSAGVVDATGRAQSSRSQNPGYLPATVPGAGRR